MAGLCLDSSPASLKLNALFNLCFFLWCFSDTIQIGPITDLEELGTELFAGLMILAQWAFPAEVDK